MKQSLFTTIFFFASCFFSFMNAKAQEPYAIISDDHKTLTFLYDEQKVANNGMDMSAYINPIVYYYGEPTWKDYKEEITTIVFDESFARCNYITQTSLWFFGCSNLTSIIGIEYLRTNKVMNMQKMFDGCSLLTELDVSHFETSNVTNMKMMFKDCRALKSLDISNFNTCNVDNMVCMFQNCSSLKNLDVSRFNTINVTAMTAMFAGCSSLQSLDVSNFNTKKVSYLYELFEGCSSLTSLDLRSFEVENISDMSRLFYDCSQLTTIYCDHTWFCTESAEMFYNCVSLEGAVKFSEGKKDVEYANPAFGYFTSEDYKSEEVVRPYALLSEDNTTLTFYYDDKRTNRSGTYISPNGLSYYPWELKRNITTVVFDKSFANCYSVTSTRNWFRWCNNLNKIEGFEYLNSFQIRDMSNMFTNCSSLTTLDLTHLDTSAAANLVGMFYNCSNLTTIYCNDTWFAPRSGQPQKNDSYSARFCGGKVRILL